MDVPVCTNKLIFNSSLYSKKFLSKLLFCFVPIAFGAYYVYKNSNWYENDVLRPKSAISLGINVLIYILIAVVVAWTWYKMTIMCTTNNMLLDVIFGLFIGLETFMIFAYFAQKNIESARILGVLLLILFIVITVQVIKADKFTGIFLILGVIFFFVQSRILYNTYFV